MMPDRKVTVGLLAGSIMFILASVYKHTTGELMDADTALAGLTIVTFVLQYIVPNKEKDGA